MSDELVLVTGGSGFVGAHCVLHLLQSGYRVRTTVRSRGREDTVRAMLTEGGVDADVSDPAASTARLSFTVADLTSDRNWPEAVAGCAYVLHVASPFAQSATRDQDELIVPAREGTLRVLRAARDCGVKRVVVTSSFAAVGYGRRTADRAFTEVDWTDPAAAVSAYARSKTLAERAAWDFVGREGGGLELAVVNPVGVFGPVLGPDYSGSVELVRRLMDGSMPGVPRLSFNVVDARDLADLHVRAMTHPDAAGGRFLAAAGEAVSMHEIATLLRGRLGDAARRVPTRRLPDLLVRLIGVVSPQAARIVPDLGKVRTVSHEKARRVLDWSPRSPQEALLATAESLVRLGLVGGGPR